MTWTTWIFIAALQVEIIIVIYMLNILQKVVEKLEKS